jgi:hypothetical protein
MDITKYPLVHRSEVDCPPEGFSTLFRDKGNAGLLTAKNSDCSFDVLSVCEVDDSALSKIYSIVNQIVDDAGCALKKGQMSADQYQDTVENINMCIEVNIDPFTGSQQQCITNTPTLFVALSTTDVLCNGGTTGTASVIISGGTAPYTTTWTDLSSTPVDPANLPAGSFIVTVEDANGKTKAVTFVIQEPAALSANTSSTPETGAGNDGTATVDVSGGTAPYTYLWDDGGAQTTATAVGLTAGDYNCVVTDANGCVLNVGPITVN